MDSARAAMLAAMRRALWFLLLVVGCAEPGEAADEAAPVERPAPEAVERSPDENEPVEPRPSVELTGAVLAAHHQRALQLREGQPAEAVRLLEEACDRSHSPSCVALADMVEAGEGAPADPDRARALLEQACFDGAQAACDRLGH